MRTKDVSFVGLVLLFALVSLIPFQYIPFPTLKILGFVVRPLRFIPVIVIFLLSLLLKRRLLEGGVPLSGPMAFFIIVSVLGGIASQDPLLSLSRILYYTLTGFLLYAVAFLCVGSGRTLHFVKATVLVSGVVAAYGTLEFILGYPPLLEKVYSDQNPLYFSFVGSKTGFGGAHRIHSTLCHPVYLGLYLVLHLPLALWLALEGRPPRARILGGACFVLMSAALLLTFSRGSWAAFLVGLGVYLVRRGRRALVAGLAGVLIVSIAVLAVSPGARRLVLERNPFKELKRISSVSRVVSARPALQEFLRSPLFGVGTANFRVGRRYQTPDNAYLMLLAETGTLGFGAMAYILLGILRGTFYGYRSTEDVRLKELQWALLAGMVGFLFNGVTCDSFYFPTTRMAFWTLAGVSMANSGGGI